MAPPVVSPAASLSDRGTGKQPVLRVLEPDTAGGGQHVLHGRDQYADN